MKMIAAYLLAVLGGKISYTVEDILGPGRYVAPEVYRNEEYDTKVDDFSFSLILQEVNFTIHDGLNFKGPKWVGNIYQKFKAICHDVDDIVKHVIRKHMQKERIQLNMWKTRCIQWVKMCDWKNGVKEALELGPL